MSIAPSAFLYDLDGTLVDSNPAHYRAWQEILAEFDQALDLPAYQAHVSGRTNAEIVQDFLPQLSVADGAALSDRKERRYRDLAGTLVPMAGFERVLDYQRRRQWRAAVVTNAPRANAEFVLAVVPDRAALGPLILAEECPAGKPDPAPYRIALEAIGVAPDRAIAFEDSPAGVRAAVAAGVATVGVTTSHGTAELYAVGVSLAIADFNDPSLWQWLEEREGLA